MADPKARWEKGTPETKARMADLSLKAKEAREARQATAAPSPIHDPKAPFTVPNMTAVRTVDVNEFTGVNRGFPQTSFGPNFMPEQTKTQFWPGDKR